MWFTKFSVLDYQSTQPISYTHVLEQLEKTEATACPDHEWMQIGWVSPYPESSPHRPIAHAHQRYIMMRLNLSQRLLPPAIIQQYTKEAIAEAQCKQEEPLKAFEKKQIKEQTVNKLLPRAFIKKTTCDLYLDTQQKRLFIGSTSQSLVQHCLALLRHSLPGFTAEPIHFETALVDQMTQWLQQEKLPEDIIIHDQCCIADYPNQQSKSTFKGQDLDDPYILNHIHSERKVVELALEWPENMRFTLKEPGVFSRIKYLDGLQHQDQDSLDPHTQFITDFTLMTASLTQLLNRITANSKQAATSDEQASEETLMETEVA